MAIHHGGKHIVPDVKLPLLVEKRLLNILLQDECFGGAIIVAASLLDDWLDLFQREADNDAVSSIC